MKSSIKATAQTEESDLERLLSELANSYAAEIARIDHAINRLGKRMAELVAAAGNTTEAELESIVWVKQREAHELRVQGKGEEADKKLKEAEEARAVPGRLSEAYDDCVLHKAMLENDRVLAASKVLDEWKPKVVELIRVQERKLYGMLECIEAAITDFIDETGNTPVFGKAGGIDSKPYIDSLVAKDGDLGEMRRKWHLLIEQNYIWKRR